MEHRVENAVVSCIDFRIQEQEHEWIRSVLKQADLIVMAGASKAFTDSDTQAVALKELEISHQLHGMQTVHLIDHLDCGAFGGSSAYTNEEKERAFHAISLNEAADIIESHLPVMVMLHLYTSQGVEPITRKKGNYAEKSL